MNYWKLMLAVCGGILLAGAIVLGFLGYQDYRREQRIRSRYLASGSNCLSGDCSSGSPYAKALKSVDGRAEKIPMAAQMFCLETEWKGASEDRRGALLAQCIQETSRHLAEDMK